MEISVIIPAYMEEGGIERCLKAIIDQKYEGGVEIIVADAESTDKTLEIAKKYTDDVYVFKKSTISAGRKDGASKAHGDILVSTDADSVPDKMWLSELVKAFEDQSVVGVHGNVYMLDAGWLDEFFIKHVMPIYYGFFNFLGHPTGPGSNIAIRKSAYEKIGGYDPLLVTCEDLDLQRRVKRVGKVVFAPKAIVYTSSRRLRAWGHPKFFFFHFTNLLMNILFNKPAERYEPIR